MIFETTGITYAKVLEGLNALTGIHGLRAPMTKLTSYLTGQITALIMQMGRELDAEARTGTPVSSCEAELQRLLQVAVFSGERPCVSDVGGGFAVKMVWSDDSATILRVLVVFTYPLRGGEVQALRKFILEKP